MKVLTCMHIILPRRMLQCFRQIGSYSNLNPCCQQIRDNGSISYLRYVLFGYCSAMYTSFISWNVGYIWSSIKRCLNSKSEEGKEKETVRVHSFVRMSRQAAQAQVQNSSFAGRNFFFACFVCDTTQSFVGWKKAIIGISSSSHKRKRLTRQADSYTSLLNAGYVCDQ